MPGEEKAHAGRHGLRRGEDLPERGFVVTFDDGFQSVHDVALPALKRTGLPAAGTIAACTWKGR